MKKTMIKKLVLGRETIRGLEQTDLTAIEGGDLVTTRYPNCSNTCSCPTRNFGC